MDKLKFISLLLLLCLFSCGEGNDAVVELGIIPESPIVIDAPFKLCPPATEEEGEEACIDIAEPWIRVRFYVVNPLNDPITVVVLKAKQVTGDEPSLIDFSESGNVFYDSPLAVKNVTNCTSSELTKSQNPSHLGYIFIVPPKKCIEFQYPIFLSLQIEEEENSSSNSISKKIQYIQNLYFEIVGWVGDFEDPKRRLRAHTRIRTQ